MVESISWSSCLLNVHNNIGVDINLKRNHHLMHPLTGNTMLDRKIHTNRLGDPSSDRKTVLLCKRLKLSIRLAILMSTGSPLKVTLSLIQMKLLAMSQKDKSKAWLTENRSMNV